jgi:rod shape determining protein RodA
MRFSLDYFKKLDWWLIISTLCVSGFGLASIYSTSAAKSDFGNIQKQLLFFGVGLVVMFLVSFFDYRILKSNSYLILALYFFCVLLLVGLHFFAPMIRGTRGWYRIGFLTLDPIEPLKIVMVILLAKYFSMRHVEMYKFRHIMISFVYVAIPALFIFIKPDLGGTMILMLMWLGILMVSGIKVKHFLILFLCFLLVAGFSWQFLLKDYQKGRVLAFLFPYDVLGGSWSQTQTKISIGSGQLLGEGVGKGSQVQYGFLPEPHTDFIFSVIGEEWGALGMLGFFVAYGTLIWRVLKIGIDSASNFPRLFAVGFAIMLIAQFSINIGMNLAMLPVVGIYLPLVSYGGSGLIANFISLGILQSIKTRSFANY